MDTSELTTIATAALTAAANPVKARPMAAYMKTDMPFYGVQKAGRVPILRKLTRNHSPASRIEYERAVLALWDLPHREEKYLAIGYARAFDDFVTMESMPLYWRLVVEGAWWDFIDEVASKLVGSVLLRERPVAEPTVRGWIPDDDMWLRRTSIICQLGHKSDTDAALLDDACTANLPDTEFFIRKAIGWALRQYARFNEEWVRGYVDRHRDELSGLSFREATKNL